MRLHNLIYEKKLDELRNNSIHAVEVAAVIVIVDILCVLVMVHHLLIDHIIVVLL
jgi:hypothetical protein